jgi:hypothetical protein
MQEERLEGTNEEACQEQVVVNFHRIEFLESFGINKADISKLKNGGYHTVESVNTVDLNDIFYPTKCMSFFIDCTFYIAKIGRSKRHK